MLVLFVRCVALLAASAAQAQDAGSTFDDAFARALAHQHSGDMAAAVTELEVAVAGRHRQAAARLAELLVKDGRIASDEQRALELATFAVRGAPDDLRLVLEDSYHSVYCAVSPRFRRQTDGREPATRERSRRNPIGVVRTCADGAEVAMPDD